MPHTISLKLTMTDPARVKLALAALLEVVGDHTVGGDELTMTTTVKVPAGRIEDTHTRKVTWTYGEPLPTAEELGVRTAPLPMDGVWGAPAPARSGSASFSQEELDAIRRAGQRIREETDPLRPFRAALNDDEGDGDDDE